MAHIPSLGGIDHTFALLNGGYDFIRRRCDRLQSDIFSCRILLQPVICMRGAQAAEFFYDGSRFTRRNAMPVTVLKLLQDYGSVQALDDGPHRHRKSLFMGICGPDGADRVTRAFEEEWNARLPSWRGKDIVLLDEMHAILTRAALNWCGIPPDEADAGRRTFEFSEMIASTGTVGLRNWRAQLLRRRSEAWARKLILDLRSGKRKALENSPIEAVATFVSPTGEPLPIESAVVELLNLLRPTVAVARFIVFGALALQQHPTLRVRVQEEGESFTIRLAEEIRRTAPFFPSIRGRAREDLVWNDMPISKDAWVLLDLYGTNCDGRVWDAPETVRPDRFLAHEPTPFDFVPQGAGDPHMTHRCPGERITVALLVRALQMLASSTYVVPEQDLTVKLSRIPAQPRSGFVLRMSG